jgi:hypothetical protein
MQEVTTSPSPMLLVWTRVPAQPYFQLRPQLLTRC